MNCRPACIYLSWTVSRNGGFRDRRAEILSDIAIIFFGIFIEAFPFLMIGVILSSLLTVFVSPAHIARVFPRGAARSLAVALVAGFAFPVCECGNIPVARGMLAKGVGPGPVITFLLAAPVFNPIAIVATAAAFPGRPEITWLRVGFTGVIAVVAGALFVRSKKEDVCREEFLRAPVSVAGSVDNPGLGEKAGGEAEGEGRLRLLKSGLMEAVMVAKDEFFYVTRYLVAGAVIAALVRTAVPQQWILNLGKGQVLSILAMVILAFVVSMCSNVDAFFAAVFADTFTAGSLLAFLVFGPMIDIKAVSMLYSTFKVKPILQLTGVVLALTFILCMGVNLA